MIYQYTVFQAQNGYMWEKNAPDNFYEITDLLTQCRSLSHNYYLFHRGNVLRIQKRKSTQIKEREYFVYTAEDFRNEDGTFTEETGNPTWHQVAENFLSGMPPFFHTNVTEEEIPGILQDFAQHLPESLISGLLIDDYNGNSQFFSVSQEMILHDTETLRFIKKLPVFEEQQNSLFRALCLHEGSASWSILAFLAVLSAELPTKDITEFQPAYARHFDLNLIEKIMQFFHLSVNESFLKEVRTKMDSRIPSKFGISRNLVFCVTTWYLELYSLSSIETLKQILHLCSCYEISSRILLPVLETWEQEPPSELPTEVKRTVPVTYSEFIRAMQSETVTFFTEEEPAFEELEKIYSYILKNSISAETTELLFDTSPQNPRMKYFLQFLHWKEHSRHKKHEKNILPAVFYWSNLVSEEELKEFYGDKAESMKKKGLQLRCPERVRHLPKFSRQVLLANRLSEPVRKENLYGAELAILIICLLCLLVILGSVVWLILVMNS